MDLTTVLRFFDFMAPCPDQILNCKDLRNSYMLEINNLTSSCKECERIKIRDKYIEFLKK